MAEAAVMVPLSRAGAYTDTGLVAEPGCRADVAQFQPRSTSLAPVPPTMATTSPV